MTKKNKAAVGYDHITPQLLEKVKVVIAEADRHKYSISRVYGAHNAVFKKNDPPQACSSCLRNRVRELRAWLKGAPENLVGSKTATTVDKEIKAPPVDPYAALVDRLALHIEGGPKSELATLNTMMEEGYPLEISPEEREAVLARIGALEAELGLEAGGDVEPQYEDPVAPGFVEPAVGVIRYPMGDGYIPFDFTPSAEDANKGTVINADGSKIKAGSYTAANGTVIAVQPGGKASIKAAEEDLT